MKISNNKPIIIKKKREEEGKVWCPNQDLDHPNPG